MRIMNLATDLSPIYPGGQFDLACWEQTLQAADPDLAALCLADMQADIKAGLIRFEEHLLPVLQAAYAAPDICAHAIASFEAVTSGLEQRIRQAVGCPVEADIILYPGLCNAAGWVTQLRSQDVILLGMEKIVELRWQDMDAMHGLILHELGHVYQRQQGILEQDFSTARERYLWQLYTEGVAMHFEQLLIGEPDYFHQDHDGWANWCRDHLPTLARDFFADLDAMRPDNQRYFGDWVSYRGRGDTGYYLGAKFVDFICQDRPFSSILNLEIAAVENLYQSFLHTLSSKEAP